MVRIMLVISLFLVGIYSHQAQAGREQGFYLEYGLGIHDPKPKVIEGYGTWKGETLYYRKEFDYATPNTGRNPLGIVKLYYRSKNDWEAGLLHISSVPDKDLYAGYNILYATKRVRLF